MQRRTYLGAVAAGLAPLSGGTTGDAAPPVTPEIRTAVRAARRPAAPSPTLPVPRSELVVGGPRGTIPALVDPAVAPDWRTVDGSLGAGDLVIGVERAGRARAYPLSLLTDHEVVNDELGGPLVVTYCPLCASGVVADRSVGGTAATFSASGYLYRGDLVLYDHATGSLWSQLLATAIHGPATGNELSLVPATLTTWSRWRADRPATDVVLPPPASDTVTAPLDPLPRPGSASSGHLGVADVGVAPGDDRLPPRELVIGVGAPTAARAYGVSALRRVGPVNDRVGDLPVVVGADPVPHAYARVVDGRVPRFAAAGRGRLRGAGSTWSLATGVALDGPHEGTALPPAGATTPMFWFAWLDFHPETTVYGRD